MNGPSQPANEHKENPAPLKSPSTAQRSRDLDGVSAAQSDETRRALKMRVRDRESFRCFVTQKAFWAGESTLRRLFKKTRIPVGKRQPDISEGELAQLFDANRPTIAFSLSHSNTKEMVLVALAAARARSAGQAVPNVVFFPPTCVPSLFTKRIGEKEHLYLQRGIVVGADGSWREGRFPRLVPVTMVGTFQGANNPLVSELEALNIPLLNGSKAFTAGRDKTLNKKVLEELGIRSPTFLLLDLDHELPSWKKKVDDFVTQHDIGEVVIKPTSGSHGDGVQFAPSTSVAQIPTVIERLLAADKPGVIIEERIKSFPVRSPTGRRQDWNFRLLVSKDGVIDWEARVLTYGKVVNKAKGAHIEEVKEVLKRTGLPDDELKRIVEEIKEIGLKIAKHLDAGYLGIDLLLSEDKLVWVIEINAGAVGGLVSLAEIRSGDEGLAAAAALLRKIQESEQLKNYKPPPRSKGHARTVASDPWNHAWLRADLNRWIARYNHAHDHGTIGKRAPKRASSLSLRPSGKTRASVDAHD